MTSTASLRTSKFRFIDGNGHPLDGPTEWTTGVIELDVPSQNWSEARLRRNGRLLPLSLKYVGEKERVVAEWPRSGTGNYELSLERPGAPPYSSPIRIMPSKISPQTYAELLASLDARLPISIALGLKKSGALASLKILSPQGANHLSEEIARLRRAVGGTDSRPGLTSVLAAIAKDPHKMLTSTEAWVHRDRARRVRPARLAQVVAAGRNIGGDRLPVQLPEAHIEESADVYENRLLKTFHEQVDRRLRRLAPLLEDQSPVLRNECEEMLSHLAAARRAARFLDAVSPLSHLPDRLTMVIMKRPEYRSGFEGFVEFHRSAAVRFEDPALETPLEDLPSLYETWGVLQVLDELLAVAVTRGFVARLQRVVARDAGGIFIRVLRDGQPALVLARESDGCIARLIPQRTYSPGGHPFHSVSYAQRPDVAVEVERPGQAASIYLFDPKYKLDSDQAGDGDGRPKKVDIDTMHAYRDAIRNSAGDRPVAHASILYPGPNRHFGPGIGALSALPGEEEGLRQEIGVVLSEALRPAQAL